MSRRTRHVSLTAELVGDPVEGVWCGPCKLPSATAAVMVIHIEGKLHGVNLAQACNDCGHEVVL